MVREIKEQEKQNKKIQQYGNDIGYIVLKDWLKSVFMGQLLISM